MRRTGAARAAIFLAILTAAPAFADGDESKDVETHAFLSQNFILTSENNYLAASSKLGSFDFTEGGINFTKQLGDNLRTGLQLFASDLGSGGNFNVQLDWFYMDYRWTDWLGFKFGRLKIPFGLYNELNDVDSGRAPILLPQSVYPIQSRNFLLAQTGIEFYGYTPRSIAGALDYRAYLGTINVNIANTVGSPVKIQSLNVPYVAGGRLLWETPLDGLRAGITVQALRLDTGIVVTGNPAFSAQIPALLWVGSLEYTHRDLLLAAEYSQWDVGSSSSNQALVPNSSVISQRAYVMGAYRLNSLMQPALYYSILHPDINMQSGSASEQQDISATMRFDINPNWLVKVEGHYMIGTAGLDPTINSNTPMGALPDHWMAFLVRTTAYF